MKSCKSCKKAIDDVATKCPHCQSFQNWFRNPQYYGTVISLMSIPLIFWMMGIWFVKEYRGNESFFSIKEVSHNVNDEKLIINYEIVNSSSEKWHSLKYELLVYGKNGILLFAKSNQEYNWMVQPNGKSMLTVEIDNRADIDRWEIKIKDLKTGRF
jgi:hypothetical protein